MVVIANSRCITAAIHNPIIKSKINIYLLNSYFIGPFLNELSIFFDYVAPLVDVVFYISLARLEAELLEVIIFY